MSARRMIFAVFLGFALLGFVLVLAVNRGLAGLANDFFPGAGLWVHLVLLAAEGLALLWFWRGLFRRRHYLMVKPDPTPEERLAFARELSRRLAGSPLPWEKLPGDETDESADYVAGNVSAEPFKSNMPRPGVMVEESGAGADFPRKAHKLNATAQPEALLEKRVRERLAELNAKADEEIKNASRRVFLGTALSQNGRLDGLIVFISLCRLVWRISSIYNQRPHPREVMSLYWTVVSATFLALSIEELNLTTEITVGFGESLQATAPAAATSSMPFVGAALQTFTASAIDGAANCFLTLRAGIITRNAYAYSLDGKRPGRAAVFREAGGMLLGMSGSLMEHLARSLGNCLGGKISGLGRAAQEATAQMGKSVADTTIQAGKSVAGVTALAGKSMADATLYTGKTVAGGMGKVGGGVADAAVKLAGGTAGAVLTTGRVTGKAAGKAVETAGEVVAGVAGGVAKTTVVAIKTVGLATGRATGGAAGKAGRIVSAPFRRNK